MNIFKKRFAILFFALLMVSAFTVTTYAKSIHNNKRKSTGYINAGVVMDVYTESDIPPSYDLYGGSAVIFLKSYSGTVKGELKDLTTGKKETIYVMAHGNPTAFTLDIEHRYQIKFEGRWKVTSTDRVSILSW